MKWFMTLVVGIVIGGGAVVYFINKVPLREPVPVVVVEAAPATPAVVVPDPAPAAAAPAAASVPLPAESLPPVVAPAIAPTPPVEMVPLVKEGLLIPVANIEAGKLADTYGQARGKERRHEALDIMAATGTPVLAVADGKLVKLFKSKPGGITVYQFDPTEKYAYYYAHLDRYADGIKEGQDVKRGDLLGYVGSTGNADPKAPHLHFAVFELGAEKQWWKGKPLNPYPLLTGQK